MKTIEEEIKQERFGSQQQKTVLNILITANAIRLSLARLFKPHGISTEQYNVLRILRGQKGAPIGVIGIQERMLDKSSNASRLVDKLLEKGLVERKGCPANRRQVEVFITKQGLNLLALLDGQIKEYEYNAIDELLDSDIEELNKILNKVRTHFN